MKQPENQSKKYDALFSDIDQGRVKIPQFQRDFVWDKQQTAKLIDSLIKGYPVGTFILWKTRERLRHYRNLGNVTLPEPPSGDSVQYILDGQQRLTSLYAVRKGIILDRDGEEIDYKDICIDLGRLPDDEDEVVFADPEGFHTAISVHDLLSASIGELNKRFPQHLDTISAYQSRLKGYDFSTIVIEDYPIDIACEIFTRINTGGKELTLFEIMVAKTYDYETGFDLSGEYDRLIDANGQEKDLEDADFDTIPSVTVLQSIAAHVLAGPVKRKEILKIPKHRFIAAWPQVKNGLFVAVDFLRHQLGVPVGRLLPYNTLLVPLTYFFVRHGATPISTATRDKLTRYFFWAALSRRYTSAVETKVGDDLERMDSILAGGDPDYPESDLRLVAGDWMWRRFSTTDAFCQAVLCLLCRHKPLSLRNNASVNLDNSCLTRSNSRNYHHLFPKAWLKKKGFTAAEVNIIPNIIFVDDYLNKHVIRAKAPSQYMQQFIDENEQLDDALASHLIDKPQLEAILADDYRSFVGLRAATINGHLLRILGR